MSVCVCVCVCDENFACTFRLNACILQMTRPAHTHALSLFLSEGEREGWKMFSHNISLPHSLFLTYTLGRFFTLKHIYLQSLTLSPLIYTHSFTAPPNDLWTKTCSLSLYHAPSCRFIYGRIGPEGGLVVCVCVAPTAHTSTISSHHLPPPLTPLIRRSM